MDETTVKNEGIDATGKPEQSSTSAENISWDAEKYPAWQKSIGKQYWGNPALAKYDTLGAMVDDVCNPKKKAPEKYSHMDAYDEEFSKKLDKIYRDADVDDKTAESIGKLFGTRETKKYTEENLKDVYGLDYDTASPSVERAIEKVCGDNSKLKESIKNSSFKNDPAFFEFARIVGRNLGDGEIFNFRGEPHTEKKDVWADMVSKPKESNDYTKW